MAVDAGALSPEITPAFKPSGAVSQPTQELRDLLAYVTAARRWGTPNCPHGHQNLMWFSWEPRLRESMYPHYHWPPHPGELRRNVPGTGNYMWWVTAWGARHIRQKVLALPARLNGGLRVGVVRRRPRANADADSAQRQERSALARARRCKRPTHTAWLFYQALFARSVSAQASA
eukprot:5235902-Alexandrium_andersonii.AAC.1